MIGVSDKKMIDITQKYISSLHNIQCEKLDKLDISKVLFNECIYVQSKSIKEIIKKCILSILNLNNSINLTIKNCALLTITRKYHRNDHDTYWETIKNEFDFKDEIIIDYLSRKEKIEHISLTSIIPNIHILGNFYLLLKCIDNRAHRCYLASVLTDVYAFKVKCLDKINPPRVVMTFFDADPLESFAMQYFANKGSVTITNQHGYPIYRPGSSDLLNQSQIINLSSNYYLAKGEFTKKQFISAGFDEGRIKIVGSIQDKKEYISRKNNCFAIFLDTPAFDFGNEANLKMVQLAIDVSKETSWSFIVKIHPADKNRKMYERMLNGSLGRVASQGTTNEEIYTEIDFGVIHASSIYINLIIEGIKMYKLEIGYDFHFVESEDDIVFSSDDLVDKFKNWLDKSPEEREKYIALLQDYYSVDDARKNIREFVEKFQ